MYSNITTITFFTNGKSGARLTELSKNIAWRIYEAITLLSPLHVEGRRPTFGVRTKSAFRQIAAIRSSLTC